MTCMETDGIPKEVLQNAYETCAKIWEEKNNTLEEGLENSYPYGFDEWLVRVQKDLDR